MEEVEYLANDDVTGFPSPSNTSPSVAKPGKLYSAFPTKAQGSLCLPTKEVGIQIFEKVI
jgi:hypothetical protein